MPSAMKAMRGSLIPKQNARFSYFACFRTTVDLNCLYCIVPAKSPCEPAPCACLTACVIMPRPQINPVFPMNKLLVLSAALFLSGCQSLLQSAPESSPPVEESMPEPATIGPDEYASFSRDTLYSLLVAELAGQRNRFDIALNNYVRQANADRKSTRLNSSHVKISY